MKFKCVISNIQHIKELSFNIDLSENKLMCIIGKNSVGKTTLIRSIENLKSADTFAKTASPYIFNKNSRIFYTIGENEYDFQYNPNLETIDTKAVINDEVKKSMYVELPIPHGVRFGHFQRLSQIDKEIRRSIPIEKYSIPNELISFLSKIYNSDRFINLKEITVKGINYYFILKEEDFYIREDYLSSGEYFVIHLYKMIQRKCKFIVIDEIDISLDSSAQVNLINELRKFCKDYQVNIVFTTHSLALMKTLIAPELCYMENSNGIVTFESVSYNYAKSILFGFQGWDKYILTEDDVLESYITHLLSQSKGSIYFKYKIIYIGGGTNVVSLMNRNKTEHFLSSPENVIGVLDGDQNKDEARLNYCKNNDMIKFIPFQSVEKQLKEHYENENRDGLPIISFNNHGTNGDVAKRIYEEFKKTDIMSDTDIFNFINERKIYEVERFKMELIDFLNINIT